MSWGDWDHGAWQAGWDRNGEWKSKPTWERRWGETSSPAKNTEDWSKYTYLNGGAKSTHTVPSEQRAWLIREIMSKVQEDGPYEKLKLPVLKTLTWNVNTLDSIISIFCGIGRRMAIASVGKTRDAVLAACVEGFQTKWPDVDERRQIMVKVIDLADKEEALLEMAVEDGFNYEPEAPPTRGTAAAPGAAQPRAAGVGGTSSHAIRSLQRQSTPDLINQLEKRRKLANMEKEAALAESEAMAARHAAANGRMWQEPSTPAQATPAAPPGSVLATVDHGLFGTGGASAGTGAGAGSPAAAHTPGDVAAAPGATAATGAVAASLGATAATRAVAASSGATAATGAAAAAPGQPQQSQSQQPPAVAGHDTEEQARQAAIRDRERLLGTVRPAAEGQQPPSDERADEGAGSRLPAQGNSQQESQAQTTVEKMAKLAEELKQMKMEKEQAMRAESEAQTREQQARSLLAEVRMEEEAIRSRAQGLQESAEAQRAEAADKLHKCEQAAQDAEIKHLSEMKDLEMQMQNCKHTSSMQEVSHKAEVTQLRTELQNAEREARLHRDMQSMELQAEQTKCSALQAELEEAKNSDE